MQNLFETISSFLPKDKINEILNSEVAKSFIGFVLNQIIQIAKENDFTIKRDLIDKIITEKIDKVENLLAKNTLYTIKDFLIEHILNKLETHISFHQQGDEIVFDESIQNSEIIEINENEYESNQIISSATKMAELLSKKGIISPMIALDAIQKMTDVVKEYLITKEVETTKRLAIQAEKEIYLTRINAQKEFLITYLEKTYDERSKIFEKQFEVIDNALKNENINQLALGLNAINDLAKSNPFKQLSDLDFIGKALQNPNHIWDF